MRAIFKKSRVEPMENGTKTISSTTNDQWDNDSESLASTTGSETRLIRAVHSAYRQWAYFIVRHAWAVIAISSIVSALCSVKIFITPHKNDITGYTPYGARSRYEASIKQNFFGQLGQGPAFGAFLLLMPKNGHNILNSELMKEIVQIDDIVRNNITISNHAENRRESFAQICQDFCSLNDPVRNFYKGYQHQLDRLAAGESLHPRIKLQYPITTIYERRFSIQPNFYGITFINPEANNSTALSTVDTSNILTNIKSVEMIALIYRAERNQKWTDDEVKEYELSISKEFEKLILW